LTSVGGGSSSSKNDKGFSLQEERPQYDCTVGGPPCAPQGLQFRARGGGAHSCAQGKASAPANAEAVQSPRTLIHRRPRAAGAPLTPRIAPRAPDTEGAGRPPTEAATTAGEGLVLTRYRLLERLGAGGFGVVWRAHDEELRREVAIKRVQRAHRGERAQREALATARLAHPAIAALYEARAQGDSLYLISELVPGEPLSKLIARGVLDDISVLETGVALTEALEHAHARGVVHRDVKPANVIVLPASDAAREHAPAKLTDFGSASIAGDDALTRTGDVLGTLAYMAPEQSEGFAATPASDLYSLALVLYEALSGFNPRRGATPAATARKLDASLPPLARERGDLPTGVAHAVDRALAPEPERRGTLADLRDALGEALGERPSRTPRGLLSPRLPTRPRDGGVPATVRQPSHAPSSHPPPMPPRDSYAQDAHALPASYPPLPQLPAEHPPLPQPAPASRVAVSRLFWWAGALAAILWQALSGNPGLALVLSAFLAPLLALPRRAGPGWLAAALAPLLGAVGLGGAFPAIAGQARTLRARAGLAALGYWWLLLAQTIASKRLWLWPHGQRIVPAEHWIGSFGAAWAHAVRPLLTVGTLEGAALWAGAAAILPWVVRGRSAALDIVAASVWAAALLSAERLLDGGLSAHSTAVSPRGALLGAVLCGALAVCARALRGPVTPRFRTEGGVT
jgi:serine/threonine protein kinase